MDAWNRHDAKAFAAVFAEDADFTNWRGEGASGRSKIEEFHAPMFASIFKNSHQRYTAIKTRLIRPDVAAVDVHWEMTGAMDAQGNPRPDRQGLLNFAMAKNAGQWQIVVMHNLDLTALPPSNSAIPKLRTHEHDHKDKRFIRIGNRSTTRAEIVGISDRQMQRAREGSEGARRPEAQSVPLPRGVAARRVSLYSLPARSCRRP
jgi:uncharacterized protein (TIGR02246 family)